MSTDSSLLSLEPIVAKIKSMLGSNISVDIVFQKEIPTPKSGKFLFTMSKVKPTYR